MSLHSDEHLDPTAEISLDVVKKRAVKGVTALTGRHFLLYGVSFIAQGLLGALLAPEQWGVFGVVSAVVNFLVYFSDVGLAASLIQSKEKITNKDLKTTFSVQQILVVSLLAILFIATPHIRNYYNLSDAGMYLLYALGFSFFLSSLKTIPSVLLEREIKFEKIAAAGIAENLVYNSVLVFFAWRGMGVMSFAWAVLARGVVGLVIIYILRPWMPSFGISKSSLSRLLKFGLPYQVNTFIAVLKDDGLTIVLGKVLGLESMGIFIWAKKWADMPLRLFLDHVTKVTFPAFARMQDDKKQMAGSITRSLFFITFLIFPSIIGLILLAPVLVRVIPQYEKWIPALTPLAILGFSAMIASFTTQLTNVLDSIGKIKTKSKFMVMWAVLTWIFVPFLSREMGATGAAIGYLIVSLSSFIAIYIIRKMVEFSFWKGVGRNFVAASAMGLTLYFIKSFLPTSIVSIFVMIFIGGVIYLFSVYLLVGKDLISDAKRFISVFFSK